MKSLKVFLSVFIIIIIIISAVLIIQHKRDQPDDAGGNNSMQQKEKSDQERAEEYAKKMKPKIEEDLRESDIHGFIKKITFKNQVTINPMGHIIIRGYINDEPERFSFEALLRYESGKVDSMSYDPDLSDRFIDWDEYKDEPEVKENYLKSFTKEEREQYLRDIGEKK